MTNLCRCLLAQVVLLLCFGLVHTLKCKQRCRIGTDSCPAGKVCTLQADDSERCEDKPADDNPDQCLPRLGSGEVDECRFAPIDNCDSGTTITENDGVKVTVLNPDECYENNTPFEGDECFIKCLLLGEGCYYFFEDNQTICILYGKNCEIRVTRASSGKLAYRNCL